MFRCCWPIIHLGLLFYNSPKMAFVTQLMRCCTSDDNEYLCAKRLTGCPTEVAQILRVRYSRDRWVAAALPTEQGCIFLRTNWCRARASCDKMSKSVLRCENVPSIVGALKRCEKGRHSRGASTMAYCASMMQENALFDTSAERQVVVEEGAHALEVATSIKSALDQRISRLESVVEDLSGEVVYLRRRLSCFEGPNETRFNSDASHLAQSSLLTVQPWEDPPKVCSNPPAHKSGLCRHYIISTWFVLQHEAYM